MTQPEVEILMATYNGAAYIEDQIRSIQAQTFRNWKMVIHDDGSTDETITIVADFCKQDHRITILSDEVKGLGAAGNFLHLLAHARADIVMLCDQDDIWFPDKIEKLLPSVSASSGPTLVYANAHYFDKDGVIERQVTRLHPNALNSLLFMNAGIQGCSMMINGALIQLLNRQPEQVAMHDHLLTLCAICFGKIRYVDEVLMLYRQHRNNATAHHVSRRKQLRNWIFTAAGVVDPQHYAANCAFYEAYKSDLSDMQVRVFDEYFKFVTSDSVLRRLGIIWRNNFSLGGNKAVLLLKTLLRKAI